MTKEQWQNLYEILIGIHSDFLYAYPKYQNGRNKKIRDEAERQFKNAISLADNHIRENSEAYELLTGGVNNSDFGRMINYDEFLKANYFGGDLSRFLNKIKDKIESLD